MSDIKKWQECLDQYTEWKRIWKNEPPEMDIYVREKEQYLKLMTFMSLPSEGVFLDVGAGEGKMRQFLPKTLTYKGIDPLADTFPGEGVIKGVGEDLSAFQDSTVDYALIHSSLDHCVDASKVVSEVYRILKDGGKLCISTLLCSHQTDHTHSFPSPAAVEDLLKGAGFNVYKSMLDRKPHVLDIIGVKGDIKVTGVVLLGGILIGDTLRLSEYIRRCASECEVHGVGDKYNEGVLELFTKYSDVPLTNYTLIDIKTRVKGSWDDAVDFQRRDDVARVVAEYDRVFTPTEQTLACLLPPFQFTGTFDTKLPLPPEYIAVQPASCHSWKSMTEVAYAQYPYPVVNIGSTSDVLEVKGAIDARGKTVAESAYIMKNAKLVVGIDSSMTQLAAQIGVPSIKCHFGKWEYDNRNVRDCGGADLLKPTMHLVQDTVNQALEIIKSGTCDISKLSRA